MQGAIAVLSALIAREKSGRGTVIEAPLVAAALVGYMNDLIGPPKPVTGGEQPVAELFKPNAYAPEDSKEVFLQKLDNLSSIRVVNIFSAWYPCKDGRHLFMWPNNEEAINRALKALGIDKQVKREGILNEGPWVTGLDNNLYSLNPKRTDWLLALVKSALQTKTAVEWETILAEVGLAVAVIRTREEWLALESAHQSGIFTEMDNGSSTLTVPGQFCDVSGPQGALLSNKFKEASTISANEAEKLFSQDHENKISVNLSASVKKGELLQGLKVLDMTNLVAGPTATNTLAQYGADVIKADPPRFIHPGLLSGGMLEVNQGKRSILTDLSTQPGREIFQRLVLWADIVVHNCVDGVAERLGVTLKQLQQIKPDIIVCQFSAHGGLYRNRGGWEKRPGFDGNAQCVSGIAAGYGTVERPHLHGQITSGDIMGGIGGAFATLLAVYQARKTGVTGEARTSLARMINYMQLPAMIAENGNFNWGEPSGQIAVGEAFWKRMYQCKDRWIYVETTEQRANELVRLIAKQADACENELESIFLEQNYSYWLSKLQAEDIACHLVTQAQDIIEQSMRSVGNESTDEIAKGTFELMVRKDHPAGVPIVNLVPSWVRVGEEHGYKRLTPSIRYGEHTREILAELGYSSEEIEELIHLNVSYEHFPAMGNRDYFFESK